MSLSIFQKGLLMIFVPLTVNVIWIGMYWDSLNRSTALLDESAKRAETIFLMSRSVELFNKCATSLFNFVKSSGNESIRRRVEGESLELIDTLNQIDQRTEERSSTKITIQRVRDSMSQVRETLRLLVDKPGLCQADIVSINLPDRFMDIMKDAHSVLSMLDASDRNFVQTLNTQKEDLSRTKFIVLTGLILNLAIALALALFFKNAVIKRISEVSRKAHALTTQERISYSESSKDELTQLESELSDAQKKLSAGEEFRRIYMTAVAHHLQTSLTRCTSASSVLDKEEALSKSQGAKYLQRLNASVSTCLSLIDDMLLLESLDVGNLSLNIESVDLNTLACETIEIVSNLALAKGIALENRCEHISLPLDRARVRQVLVNLLSNAIKFSTPGSPIEITSDIKSKFVRIAVVDSGPGISKQASAKLFQKFFQTSEGKSAGGTGLGLAIAKLIVEAHGGLIGVESEPGKGSIFWIEIPLRR